jgi:putative toxin-antitoxin system antitoxin component (TIGR02293 family)
LKPVKERTFGAFSHPGFDIPADFDELQDFELRAGTAKLSKNAVVTFLDTSGLSQQEIALYLGIPERTLARRRVGGRLNHHESERLLRLADIYDRCLDLFSGDRQAVHQWLTQPVRGLNYARPIDFARSDDGSREVKDLIGRLDHGVYC